MKKTLIIALAGLISISTASIASNKPEVIELEHSRTSMEYGPQIRNLVNKIENFKWQGDIGLGYHFVQTDPPYDGESTKDRIFLTANTFHYGDYVGETLMYLVQSKYKGSQLNHL